MKMNKNILTKTNDSFHTEGLSNSIGSPTLLLPSSLEKQNNFQKLINPFKKKPHHTIRNLAKTKVSTITTLKQPLLIKKSTDLMKQTLEELIV
jgi:hypothetical protein